MIFASWKVLDYFYWNCLYCNSSYFNNWNHLHFRKIEELWRFTGFYLTEDTLHSNIWVFSIAFNVVLQLLLFCLYVIKGIESNKHFLKTVITWVIFRCLMSQMLIMFVWKFCFRRVSSVGNASDCSAQGPGFKSPTKLTVDTSIIDHSLHTCL